MKVSISWLEDYVPIVMEIGAIADALTMVGLEVEAVEDRYDWLNSVYVGHVLDVRPHPNADKLKLCDVDTGTSKVTVVCGAPNVRTGMLAPIALPGTRFPDGFTLKSTVIRGQQSQGMLCSEAELLLGLDKSGIMNIEPSRTCRPGARLTEAFRLSDYVLEIGLTPNRPDCLSIVGIARELAAIQKTPLSYPKLGHVNLESDEISQYTSVTIEDPDHCPRYAARLLEDITVGPSPFWLQERLLSVGLRPINNIVDITNFVLMELGQPLHAFDFDRLTDHRIVVRTATAGERFTTLDGKERVLDADTLMICDGEKPVAVGGVMGGLNSEIEESTTRVLLESAYFNPISIRKTAKKLGLSTEASHRFERGVDPEGTVFAAHRAAELMRELGQGRLIGGVIDERPVKPERKSIRLSVNRTNQILGLQLEQEAISELLTSIEFEVEKQSDDELDVLPPSFRVDVARPEDLMEEVARCHGYDKIPTTFPVLPSTARNRLATVTLRDRIRRLMCGYGFAEVVNYSFIHGQSQQRLRLDPEKQKPTVNILNPLSEEQTVMRTSLIPGMLDTIRKNLAHQIKDLKLFEIGKVFIAKSSDDLPEEIEMLLGVWTGSRMMASWNTREVPCDFFDIKGVADALMTELHIPDVRVTRMAPEHYPYLRPGHGGVILSGDRTIGVVGEIHPKVLPNFDVEQPVFIFELNVETIRDLVSESKHAMKISKFPAVHRDSTIIIHRDIEVASVLDSVMDIDEPLKESVALFDVYEGDPIPPDKKSISFRITYRSPEETLEDSVVTEIHAQITKQIIEKFDATLPI